VFILSLLEEILKVRPDLTSEDVYDIIDLIPQDSDILEEVNKFYPLNQRTGDCAA